MVPVPVLAGDMHESRELDLVAVDVQDVVLAPRLGDVRVVAGAGAVDVAGLRPRLGEVGALQEGAQDGNGGGDDADRRLGDSEDVKGRRVNCAVLVSGRRLEAYRTYSGRY